MEKTRYIIKKQKSKINGLAKFVIFSLTSVIIFTIVMIILFWKFQSIPDVLVTCFFAVFGGEVLSCALIKMFKIKSEGDLIE